MFSQWNSRRSILDYLKGRAIRILPLYWLFSLAMVALLLFLPSAFDNAEFDGWRTLTSFLFVARLSEFDSPIVFVGWTLEYEVLFYLLFAIALALRPLGEAFAIFVLALSLMLVVLGFNASQLALEFLFGVAIALGARQGVPSARLQLALAVLGLVLLAASLWVDFGWPRWLVWGGPSVLLVAAGIGTEQIRSKVLEFLGDASYSIYLIQVFTIPATYKALRLIDLESPPFLLLCIGTGVTVIAGLVAHVLIEKPALSWLKAKLAPRRSEVRLQEV